MARERLNVGPSYTMVKIEVEGIEDIEEKFELLTDERRDLYTGRVKSLTTSLETDKHFESPIVINLVEERERKRMRVLDGNHRIEAMIAFYKRNPEVKKRFVLYAARYNNLTRPQEREVYTTWNKGTPESANDYLKNYWKTIPFGKKILKELPVTLERQARELPVKLLVTSHIQAKKRKRFEGGYSAGGEQTVYDFRNVDEDDIRTIKGFIQDMTYVFGEPLRKSKYWRSTPVPAFYRIWYDNKENVPIQNMHKAFEKIRNEWDGQWEEQAKKGGRSACQSFYRDLIRALKFQTSKVNWKSDYDVMEERQKEREQKQEEVTSSA